MAHVSLILPIAPGAVQLDDQIGEHRRMLEEAGHRVEVLVVADPRLAADLVGLEGSWNLLVADEPGLAVSAVAGLRAARGDVLLVLDLERGYRPEELARVVAPLDRGEADLAVASRGNLSSNTRRRRRLSAWTGALARALVGTSDPLSGLVALSRPFAQEADKALEPVGSWYAIELLMKARGRRVDVPVHVSAPPPPRGRDVGLDGLRHLKRLADHRFGNASQLLQFCLVGASGMVVDLTCYALFQLLFSQTWLARVRAPLGGESLALAVAGALAIAVALTWNFSLNRRLTFSYARNGSLVRQFVAYVLSNALGIALSFSLRLVLPGHFGFFHRHKLAAALVGIVTATGISFSMSRWVVFRRRTVPQKTDPVAHRVRRTARRPIPRIGLRDRPSDP
jgi:dolichol-phosphate mannosyltransferase